MIIPGSKRTFVVYAVLQLVGMGMREADMVPTHTGDVEEVGALDVVEDLWLQR
jgi:glutamate formiminotransferase